jgi:hypothetical protein
MSQEYIELRGSRAFELRRVDSVLSQLARPAPVEDGMSASTRDALAGLGICVAGDATRKDLIECLWGRKRSLLSQMRTRGDGPWQPVA